MVDSLSVVLAAIYCALVFSIADSKEVQFDRVTVALARSMFLETRSSHWIFLFFFWLIHLKRTVCCRENGRSFSAEMQRLFLLCLTSRRGANSYNTGLMQAGVQ